MPLTLTAYGNGVRLLVKVVPGASRNRIVGDLGGALKIAVAAAPERGAANRAVLELLAAHLKLPLARLSLLRGEANPRKEILISGITAAELAAKLE